jgi:FAD/FMN-containing dehydrogenase
MFRALPDAALEALADAHAAPGSPISTVEIRHWGGAMANPGPDAGPAGHRDARFSVIVDAVVPELAAALRPHGMGATFLNFLADPTRTASAYTAENHRRLREAKAAYDPENLFRSGHNIRPAAVLASLSS